MTCTCGASGAIDGHSVFCGLRQSEIDAIQTRLNRVVVGLPERLEKTKAVVKDQENKLGQVSSVIQQWNGGMIWNHEALKQIERILND